MLDLSGLIVIAVAIALYSCRLRLETSRSATAADSASTINGRIAIFDIYNKSSQVTRQAPGILISTKGALIPGLRPHESVILVDDSRTGDKYFPLSPAQDGFTLVGLQPPAPDLAPLALLVVPANVDALPPLSSQALLPIAAKSAVSKNQPVILFNQFGFALGFANPRADGRVHILIPGTPQAYPPGGLLGYIHRSIMGKGLDSTLPLSRPDAVKMLRKGGALISSEFKSLAFSRSKNGRPFYIKNPKDGETIDILAFLAEDAEYEKGMSTKSWQLERRDTLPGIVADSVTKVSTKMQVPKDIEREIMQFLDCDTQ